MPVCYCTRGCELPPRPAPKGRRVDHGTDPNSQGPLPHVPRPPSCLDQGDAIEVPVHPFLRLYLNCCRLCPTSKPDTCISERGIAAHLNDKHQWVRRHSRPSTALEAQIGLHTVAIFLIFCQTFFQRSIFRCYFPLQLASADRESED